MATKEINSPVAEATEKNGKLTPISGNGDYTADSIKVLGGMEAVRKRPAMYIGSTGEMGLHHLVYEVVDNSVDEALAGHADKIEVTIHIDNSITVVDNGRGIPVDRWTLTAKKFPPRRWCMTKLHAGGKFDTSSYKVSGGLHGVGVSCVNALSEELDLEIWRDGFTWEQTYSKGEPTSKLKKAGATKKRGTKVHFLPDKSIFTATEYNFDTLAQRLRELAFLNKGLLITLTDERTTDAKTGEPKTAEFKYNGGIAEFIKHLNRGKQVLHDKPIYMEAERNGVNMEIGLQYNDAYSETVFSFANNINTVDGGTHLSGFRTALTRTINYAGQQMGLFKDVKENLTGDDVREGLVAVISVKLPQPQFEGQTKGKLNSDIAGVVQAFVNERLGAFFEQNSTGRPQDHQQSHRRRPRPRSRAQSPRPHPPQRRARRRRTARQTGRLLRAPARPLRTVPGGGRIRRRHRQAGTRPALPGHPSAEGQNSQRREGPLRQDAGARRNSRHDYARSAPAFARKTSIPRSCATAKSF